ncbi:MAG: MgtC/SapB family protein [Clostridia bacterium]|nr:MgtC/SapB family protein [Clostridia bacterium]
MLINYIQQFLTDHCGNLIEVFLRILVAGFCGAIIGFERTKRQKDAGLRTHLLLSIGCATLVVASKYGFFDVALMPNAEFFKTDLSRIISTILSGVGFIGAGVIFVRGTSVRGLTTAAGIWTTLAISVSVGIGLYEVGIFVTFVVVISQYLLHKVYPSVENKILTKVTIKVKSSSDNIKKLVKACSEYNANIRAISSKMADNDMTIISVNLSSTKTFRVEKFFQKLEQDFETTEITVSGDDTER